jgi:hypothetical protein
MFAGTYLGTERLKQKIVECLSKGSSEIHLSISNGAGVRVSVQFPSRGTLKIRNIDTRTLGHANFIHGRHNVAKMCRAKES